MKCRSSTERGGRHGHPYCYWSACRVRALGGTTNTWGGWCRPLDAIDFSERDWLPHSGWPFPRENANAVHYRRAHTVCHAGPCVTTRPQRRARLAASILPSVRPRPRRHAVPCDPDAVRAAPPAGVGTRRQRTRPAARERLRDRDGRGAPGPRGAARRRHPHRPAVEPGVPACSSWRPAGSRRRGCCWRRARVDRPASGTNAIWSAASSPSTCTCRWRGWCRAGHATATTRCTGPGRRRSAARSV